MWFLCVICGGGFFFVFLAQSEGCFCFLFILFFGDTVYV